MKLAEDGSFSFSAKAPGNPEFYRLRIDRQLINVAIDSTEDVKVKASYPTMSYKYDIEGSEDCSKIKELALMQMNLQNQINAIASNPSVPYQKEADSIKVVVENYKNTVKANYIFKAPMKAYAYFALFQTVVLGRPPSTSSTLTAARPTCRSTRQWQRAGTHITPSRSAVRTSTT